MKNMFWNSNVKEGRKYEETEGDKGKKKSINLLRAKRLSLRSEIISSNLSFALKFLTRAPSAKSSFCLEGNRILSDFLFFSRASFGLYPGEIHRNDETSSPPSFAQLLNTLLRLFLSQSSYSARFHDRTKWNYFAARNIYSSMESPASSKKLCRVFVVV